VLEQIGKLEAASEAYLKAGHTGWLLTLEESNIRAKNTHHTADPHERSGEPRLQWLVVAQLRAGQLIGDGCNPIERPNGAAQQPIPSKCKGNQQFWRGRMLG